MNKLIYSFLLCFSFLGLQAKDFPKQANPPKLVNDYSGTLNADDLNALEAKLEAYEDSTSTQIAIVIENSLEGEDEFDYSQRLAENWQIGRKGKNNGLLIYIAIEDRKIRIQNGYGLEGSITDALSKRIIEEVIKPNFKKRNYYTGLDEATNYIMRAAAGEFINDEAMGNQQGPPPMGFVIVLILFFLFIIFFGKGGRGGRGGMLMGAPFIGTFGGGGFSSGGSDSGSSFGGFGGGSFGGGGAGGSW